SSRARASGGADGIGLAADERGRSEEGSGAGDLLVPEGRRAELLVGGRAPRVGLLHRERGGEESGSGHAMAASRSRTRESLRTEQAGDGLLEGRVCCEERRHSAGMVSQSG